MNTKKIWLTAMLFGIIAAGLMYVLVVSDQQKTSEPENTTEPEAEEIEENEVDTNTAAEAEIVEEVTNELLPITEGNRAITVTVTDNQGVAGFIDPGSFVDIVAVMEAPEKPGEDQHDSATLLLQNVKVLAIGHAADDEETMKRYQMVTVEVTPKEGLSLGFASKYNLYLMLREEDDDLLEPKHTHVHEDDLHEGVFR